MLLTLNDYRKHNLNSDIKMKKRVEYTQASGNGRVLKFKAFILEQDIVCSLWRHKAAIRSGNRSSDSILNVKGKHA